MLQECREADVERFCEFFDWRWASGEAADHRPPSGVGKSVEGGVKRRLIAYHTVNYTIQFTIWQTIKFCAITLDIEFRFLAAKLVMTLRTGSDGSIEVGSRK